MEELSKLDPILPNFKIGQYTEILSGSLKGTIVKICSLPSKDRVNVLLCFLGSLRNVSIHQNDLAL
jgi:transcription antitermination factor NusG